MTHSWWRLQSTDGGVLAFDRSSGLNVLTCHEKTAGLRRVAPRALQIGLLTPCNLSCSFCYRDTSAPSRLTADFLLALLQRCAEWGVLEVAFGGGEPLLFRGFVNLVRRLTDETPLGINFTTNGMLLTDAVVAELDDWPGEIRLSAYPDNHYRQTLRRLKSRKVGVNWLVTPANAGMLEVMVHDCLSLGARDVMLLGYKGPDASLRLEDGGMRQLSASVRRLAHLPLKLDICWHPQLADVPQLFARGDCGAGDEMLVITPDRAVQPCSFHHERVPFESFEDLRRIYADMQRRKPEARIGGCTRSLFVPAPPRAPATYVWQAHAGNNSGSYTIVGRFRSATEAGAAAAALREMTLAHERFMTEINPRTFEFGKATPPMKVFAEAHGFEWPDEEGLWWEEQAMGGPNLTVGAIGGDVLVFHPYCMGLPREPFLDFFRNTGATAYSYSDYDMPTVRAKAEGSNAAAVDAVEQYLRRMSQFEYPHECKEEPPWGKTCTDPRVSEGTDRSAVLNQTEYRLSYDGARLELELRFENCFAGAIALEVYLRQAGFTQVEIQLEAAWERLQRKAQPLTPKVIAYPANELPALNLVLMSKAELGRFLFDPVSCSPHAERAIQAFPADKIADAAFAAWQSRKNRDAFTTQRSIELMKIAGPAAAEWARTYWRTAPRSEINDAFTGILYTLPLVETMSLTHEWLSTKNISSFSHIVIHGIDHYVRIHGVPKSGVPAEPAWAAFLAELARHRQTYPSEQALERLRQLSDQFPK